MINARLIEMVNTNTPSFHYILDIESDYSIYTITDILLSLPDDNKFAAICTFNRYNIHILDTPSTDRAALDAYMALQFNAQRIHL